MIKSVLQSIPTYMMSLFLLPSTLLYEIEKMMNSFWWGNKRDRARGIHWFSWDRLSMPKDVRGMGFKNCSAFNYAMLSKQAWRIMANPDTLVSRLYKARYFPNTDYLNFNIGHNPSYVWRKNPWPHNLLVSNLKVSNLLIPNGKQWNHALVLSLVGEEIAQKVQNTSLFVPVRDDILHWRCEKDGKFSVRSAYRYCINEAIDTSHLRINERWNLLWNIKTPPELRIFCGGYVEIVCLLDGDFWIKGSLIQLSVLVVVIMRKTPTIYSSSVPKVSNHDHQSMLSVILWSIWKGRNNHIWNSAEEPTDVICQRAAQLLAGWKDAQQYRLNSIGVCIRNDAGQFIAARTEWFSPCTNVAIGEAIGLLTAIKWVINLGFDNVDFELDAKQVVDNVYSVKPNDSDFGAIIDDCKRLITLFFRNSHVKFVRRQVNEVAHALARVTPFLASFHNFTDIPTCIQNIIINEMI
ncbi:uncharacterized protein LOC131605473 [Vicia villosa]|uniref:uncharacterized protein LOC131605473 n=1 Tax=Vicia villosa TaxID=3911 RepID=UPI00273BDBB7|nr:uncharacterized protein LOC131605473 [Vicia villosa]